jgi:hypothetical protein
MKEEWRPVVGYETHYEVSSHGRVRTLNRYDSINRFRRSQMRATPIDRTSAGYRYVSLCKDGVSKKVNVHVLVLEAFVGPRPSPGHEACHKDGDRANACLDNLRWDTAASNHADKWTHGTMKAGSKNHKAVFSEELVGWIRESHQSSLSLAPILGVSSSAIRAVRTGQNWRHLA